MSDTTQSIGNQIRSGLKGIHGVGEAIRGTAMEATDEAFNTPEGAVKNKAIADRGVADAERAGDSISSHGHGGVGSGTGTNAAAATGAGVHSTAPGSIGATGTTGARSGAVVQEQAGVDRRL